MKPKRLEWKKCEGPGSLWVGEIPDTPIRFAIMRESPDEYRVKPLAAGIQDHYANTVDGAKRKAQWLFEDFAVGLFDL